MCDPMSAIVLLDIQEMCVIQASLTTEGSAKIVITINDAFKIIILW